MPSATRWAGVSPADRQAERRTLLVQAAFGLFGDGGEAAVSVRSVCRAAELNTRYFYESFTDTDALLGAVYDEVALELGGILTAVMASARDERVRLRAGIRAVLDFSSADPRRGKILFTEARTNPVLAARRSIAQDHVRELVLDEQRRTAPESDRVATEVGAAMYAGAMAELAQQWLAGTLGDDVDAVVGYAVRLLLPN
ncbi:AcrR family transcriptional regulator [Mycolicibacterium sp. BK556]|uniref:TetR/AcrR family transcriptional regulator n=1 Tax=unclassified Mycolicibacterium TaxID=2636767 RepID=UPI0016191C80|nr:MULTISPECIES: TetR family transcriptional regulator [unclassified Mycolicibacterium]MBB3605566.1 AcrR family transcriptional regulator [Mycolicibacterium sp. BK556]MBB3635937.1 AcrR family transcriptional regulator [Mycolicibacterium sp. BK607]MBB3753350.1 AcrR family transcriptional regulator [Mycolicibacterium sp. BK634]